MKASLCVLLAIGLSGCSSCGPPKACPTGLFPCHDGCIPSSGVCCPNGSYCPSPQACVAADAGFTCAGGARNFPCAAGTRHCDLGCVTSAADCCVGKDCTASTALQSAATICPEQAGFQLCGQCIGESGSCSGICRYCSTSSFCGGDICGDVHCCSGSGCQTDTPADCKGTAGSGSCSGSKKMAACPDGTQKCCSENQVCCRDSANGDAIGCEFQGFCD